VATESPIAPWLTAYQASWLRPDLLAGITVAVLLIPQSMAYGLLAGLPPITGMYAALAALIVYALSGSSRQMSVGPVALDSILLASGVSLISQAGSADYLAIAILLAVLVGAMQFFMGYLQLGVMASFLANPVLSGFTSAAALIIGASQLKHLLGIDIAAGQNLAQTLAALVASIDQANPVTLSLGLAGLALLWLLKRLHPNIPAALIVMSLATALVWFCGLDTQGVAIIGAIPEGLPRLQLPVIDLELTTRVLPLAITIALVSFMESIAVAKKIAADQRYKIDSNRELMSLGASNLAAGWVGGYPVAGSLSRTAINAASGARSQMSSLFTAAILALVLVALTPLFYYTPRVCLAVIIIAALSSLIDINEARQLWRISKKDLLLLVLAFVATLALGVQNGVLLSVLASIALIFSHITRPPIVLFGQVADSKALRNMARSPNAEIIPGVLVFRIDAALYFANAGYLQDRICEALSEREDPIHAFLFDAGAITDIDSSAIVALEELLRQFHDAGIELYFSNVRGRVADIMCRSGFYQAVGGDHFFYSKRTAVDHIIALLSEKEPERETVNRSGI
jgi:SulP family sulfate permease